MGFDDSGGIRLEVLAGFDYLKDITDYDYMDPELVEIVETEVAPLLPDAPLG